MKLLIRFLILVASVLALGGTVCAQTQESRISAVKAHKVHCQVTEAISGRPEAAKLCAAQHLKGNEHFLRYWIQIAAENGDVVSQYNFAIMLLLIRQ